MAEHNNRGMEGEKIAAAYLEEKGHKILERNWKFGHEEIDIIAKHLNTLLIVEVKTRSSTFFGDPAEFVSVQKQRHLIKAANAYIEKKNLDMEVRFDIIGVILNGSNYHINHIEDAFCPIA